MDASKEKVVTQDSREIWIDNVKAIACILVAVGHMVQGLEKSGIINDGIMYLWFDRAIYSFHVPLFFICSGYLFNKTAKHGGYKVWLSRVAKRLLDLGVPYFTFTLIIIIIKRLFENDVNTPAADIIDSLFFRPISPYWFLYTLFFIVCITPAFQNKGHILSWFVTCCVLKLTAILMPADITLPYLVDRLMNYMIWFSAGEVISKFGFQKFLDKRALLISLIFVPMTITTAYGITNSAIYFVMGILGCLMVLSTMNICYSNKEQSKVYSVIVRYNMPIFAMHTIFASGIRIVLLRMGVDSPVSHLILGTVVSFLFPCIAGWIMSKTPFLEFFLYPTASIRSIKRQYRRTTDI